MKNVLINLLLIALISVTAKSQPAVNDPTFNPDDIGFVSGYGANGSVFSTVIQPDGKIIIGGNFTTYNIVSQKNRIARLNADGTPDNTFCPYAGTNSTVYAIALQPDGKIIIGGNFTTFGFTSRNRIARLNSDGTLDSTFNSGNGANNPIRAIAIQPDGKIVIGGEFTTYSGTTARRIARLNSDGTLDNTFNTGNGASNSIRTIALQSDGKIIIAGNFTSYNGTTINRIARINEDGTLDNTFNPGSGPDDWVCSSVLQPDGKIIIGGAFDTYNATNRRKIARLNVDGTLDNTFNPGSGPTSSVLCVDLQSDGKIIVGGEFTQISSVGINRIARLNSDGTLDNSFDPGKGTNSNVNCISIQSDGKIVIGGDFEFCNDVDRKYITRLNQNGTLDNDFCFVTGASLNILSIVIQPDGKILIGGLFTLYNGTIRRRIARLNNDGTLDNTFNPGTGADFTVGPIALQNDGKIVIGGAFSSFNEMDLKMIARLNPDGTIDNSFDPGTGFNGFVEAIVIQPDGKILIGGQFTSYNGTSIKYIARLNSDGSLDNSFNPGTGANNLVATIALQSDGKIIIAGNFTSYNGTTINRIARINEDGTLDNTFNPGLGADDRIYSGAIQPDGKIIIVGLFKSYNGVLNNHIVRLNPDGTIDNTFNAGSGTNFRIYCLKLQIDGKIIIVGDFTSYNGIPISNIARLHSDGTFDHSFNPGSGAAGSILTLAIQPDGKIIIGGSFYSYNNIGRNRIARLIGDCVGIETTQKQILKLYPNPNDGQFIIELDEESNITVINSLGATVHKAFYTDGSHGLDLSYLAGGVYLIKYESKDNVNVLRVVISQK